MNQQTPPVDDSVGPKSLYILSPILTLGIIFFLVRIYTRVIPAYKLNASDYTNTVAVLACVITYSLFAAAVSYGFGRHSYYVTPESSVKILQCLYGVTLTGLWASVFARISVACLLLQFPTSTKWKTILWVAIIFQLASLISTEIVELVQCHPIRAFWENVPGGQCFSPSVMWTLGYVFTGTGMVGDLIFAIMPTFLIWRLSRSVVERCLISFLMILGLFATVAGVLKILYSESFDKTSPNVFREMMPVFFWCRMEEVILIVASSAPFLKAPVTSALNRLGLPMFQFQTGPLNSIHTLRTSPTLHQHNLQNRQDLEGRLIGRQWMNTDETNVEAGEHSLSAALAHSDVSDDFGGGDKSTGHPRLAHLRGGSDDASVSTQRLCWVSVVAAKPCGQPSTDCE